MAKLKIVKKNYSVDFLLCKRINSKAQKYIVMLVDEEPLEYIMSSKTVKKSEASCLVYLS